MVKNITPQYRCLCNIVPPSVHQVSQRDLRNNLELTVPRSRTNLFNKSFIPTATREWNSLSEEIKSSTSLSMFKRMLSRDKRKVPPYFYNGDRKAQILHTRLRLGCSSLNADLFNNHISITDKGICGSIESAEHYFLLCDRYATLRDETINTINVNFNVDILLNGCPLYSGSINGMRRRFTIYSAFLDIKNSISWYQEMNSWYQKIFFDIKKYILISRIRFLDIKT